MLMAGACNGLPMKNRGIAICRVVAHSPHRFARLGGLIEAARRRRKYRGARPTACDLGIWSICVSLQSANGGGDNAFFVP